MGLGYTLLGIILIGTAIPTGMFAFTATMFGLAALGNMPRKDRIFTVLCSAALVAVPICCASGGIYVMMYL